MNKSCFLKARKKRMKKLFLLFFILFFSFTTYAQKTEDTAYFTNSDTLELYGETFAGLESLDTIVQGKKVIITGENHTYTESNARLWLKMIKYLHKNAGVRNVMFEYGYSYGWLVNEYLQTGDTNLYNSIKNFAYIEYSEAIKDLREFNAGLDSSEKIYLCAIDIERGIYPIVKLLNHLVPDGYEAHDSIAIHLESLASLASYNDHKLQEQEDDEYSFVRFNFLSNPTMELIQENFLKFEEEYNKVLGGNFELFRKVIVEKYNARKLWYKYDEEKAVQQYVYRENYMHQTFLKEYASREGSWFGQFGRCHTTQTKINSNSCDWFKFRSLANRIKGTDGGLFKDSVLTISIMYENDRSMGDDFEDYEENFDPYFEDVPESSVVLFDFAKDTLLDSVYGQDFDYIFLNTNNKKGEVYEDIFVYDDYDFDWGPKFKILGAYGTRSYGLSDLNDALSLANIKNFFTPVNAWQVSMYTGASEGDGAKFYSSSTFGSILAQTNESFDDPDLNVELKGFYVKSMFFYNLTSGVKFLDILPGVGYGFERLKLTFEQGGVAEPDLTDGYLGTTKYTTYYNPAFTLDGAIAIDLNISRLTVGVVYGVTLDLSNEHWRANNTILTDSPITSLTNMSTMVHAGFNF